MYLRPRQLDLRKRKQPSSGTTRESKIWDLPVEMLVKIFEYEEAIPLQVHRSVCFSWKEIIGQFFPTRLVITHDNWMEVIQTEARLLQVTILGNIHGDVLGHPCFQSFCARLRKLDLTFCTFNLIHVQILGQAINLESISAHGLIVKGFNSLDFVENVAKFQAQNWLPALKSLKIEFSDSHILTFFAMVLRNGKLLKLHVGDKNLCRMTRAVPDIEPSVMSIISSNRSTLRKVYGRYLEFEYHPLQAPADETRVYRTFYGAYFWSVGLFNGPNTWFQTLKRQKNLESLQLWFWNIEAPAEVLDQPQMQEIEALVTITKEIIVENSAALTQIDLKFGITSWFRRLSMDQDFDQVFQACVSLKSLALKVGFYDFPRTWNQEFSMQPGFKGLTFLPNSLKFLHMGFPILSSANSLHELEISNLANLETFIFDPSIWFIFSGTGTQIKKLGINHVKQLKSKLPKLKRLSVNVATHGCKDGLTGRVTENKLVTQGLLNRYKKTLEHKFELGVYLNINFDTC